MVISLKLWYAYYWQKILFLFSGTKSKRKIMRLAKPNKSNPYFNGITNGTINYFYTPRTLYIRPTGHSRYICRCLSLSWSSVKLYSTCIKKNKVMTSLPQTVKLHIWLMCIFYFFMIPRNHARGSSSKYVFNMLCNVNAQDLQIWVTAVCMEPRA